MSHANDTLASFALLACAWLALALGTSALIALLWPALNRRSLTWHPRSRARAAFWSAIAPGAVPTGVLLLCVAPGIAGFATGTGDHCHLHPDHAHLCLLHASLGMSGPLLFGVLLLLAGVARAIWMGSRWIRDTRAAERRLCGAARPRWDGGVGYVDVERPFAFTGGFCDRGCGSRRRSSERSRRRNETSCWPTSSPTASAGIRRASRSRVSSPSSTYPRVAARFSRRFA